MLSGSRPFGSSSAPTSGNTAISGGRSSKAGWNAATPVRLRFPAQRTWARSAEQQGGKLAPRREGRRIVEAPGLKEFQQLLARRLVVPGPVPADRVQERIGRLGALARRVQRRGEVNARRVVVGIRGEALLELGELRAGETPLGGEFQRAADGNDLRVVPELRRRGLDHLLRLLLMAERHQAAGHAGQRLG